MSRFVQGHSSLDHWPKLINSVAGVLEQSSGKDLPSTLDARCKDLQLHRCFDNLRIASKCVHQSNFVHNFAAAGFHLCYLLKVRTCADLEQAVFDKYIARVIFICLRINIP